MKYPIDVEKYIAAMRQECGPNATAERAYREAVIPFVNDAYDDGLHGKGGYPLDLEAELSSLAEYMGKSPESIQKNKLLPPLIAWVNRAYAQGRQDAKEAMPT